MSIPLQVLETVLAFTLVVVLASQLQRLGVVGPNQSPTFAKLLTGAILPAAVVHQLLIRPVAGRQFVLVGIMAVAGAVCLVLAWIAARLLRLDRPTTGALMLTSGFGSSALLGYPLVQFAFPRDPQAFSDAVLISELGVGLPLFTFGPLVAMHFGAHSRDVRSARKTLLDYRRSPIFIALMAGLAGSRQKVSAVVFSHVAISLVTIPTVFSTLVG